MSAVDPDRLRRAVHLDVTRDGDRWIVTGGAEPHVVTRRGRTLECDCSDFLIRRVPCKHRLAVALRSGHPAVVRALREVV